MISTLLEILTLEYKIVLRFLNLRGNAVTGLDFAIFHGEGCNYLPNLVEDILLDGGFKMCGIGFIIDHTHLDAQGEHEFVRLLAEEDNPLTTAEETIMHQIQRVFRIQGYETKDLDLPKLQ